MNTSSSQARAELTTFLCLTFALSAVFWWLIVAAGGLGARGGLYVFALMWSPGVSALVTRLLFQHNLRGEGWTWRRATTRWAVLGYLLPLGYATLAYGLVWLTGLGGVDLLNGYERVAEACLTTCFILSQRDAACRRLRDSGNEHLCRELLPPLARGESFATVGLSQLTTSRQHGQPALRARLVEGTLVLDGPWTLAWTGEPTGSRDGSSTRVPGTRQAEWSRQWQVPWPAQCPHWPHHPRRGWGCRLVGSHLARDGPMAEESALEEGSGARAGN